MSFWGTIGSIASSYFSSKSSGGGGGTASIFSALLGGIGGSAEAKLSVETAKVKAETEGREQRKSAGFEYQLKDYYTQKDKVRKRAALDTYGQFSQISRWAPNYVAKNPAIEQPAMPNPNT